MNLKNKKMKLSALLIACLMVGLAAYVYSENAGSKGNISAEATQELTLAHPTFSADAAAVSSFLNQEAGISIWLNATAYAPLNLNAAKNGMVYVENASSTYVIGALSDNGGITNSDNYPHCFVDQSGWIVVYYLKVNTENPGTTGYIGKIIDWTQYSNNKLSGNYLTEALNYMATNILGIPSAVVTANEKYYHFQYPSATELMLAIKQAPSTGTYTATFNIKIPSNLTIYEYSWSCDGYQGRPYNFYIDTTLIGSGSGTGYGGPQITAQILTPDVWHTITISTGDYGGAVCLILLYS